MASLKEQAGPPDELQGLPAEEPAALQDAPVEDGMPQQEPATLPNFNEIFMEDAEPEHAKPEPAQPETMPAASASLTPSPSQDSCKHGCMTYIIKTSCIDAEST